MRTTDYKRCDGSQGYGWKSHQTEPGAKDDLCAACRKVMQAAESAQPKAKRSWRLFAQERDGRFEHFYASTMQLTTCGDAPMALVRLTIDEEGPYWGWYQSHHPYNGGSRGHVARIYPHRMAVEMCFTYGSKVDVARGHGEIVRLRAERIREAMHPEGIRYAENGDEKESA